jgi:hypothetical protein
MLFAPRARPSSFNLQQQALRVPNRCAAVLSATVQIKYIDSEIKETALIRTIGNNKCPLIKPAYQALAIGSESLEASITPQMQCNASLPVQ